MQAADERLEKLGNSVCAIVSKEYTFGADAVLLADFSAPAGGRACEAGTGCGVIPLIWCGKNSALRVDAVEIQAGAAELAARAAAYNGMNDRIRIINDDLRTTRELPSGAYDLVACNPPYQKSGSGRMSGDRPKRLARYEVEGTAEDFISFSARLLKNGGRLCLCHRPGRLAEILSLMARYRVEPKRLRFVQQKTGTEPWLFLAEGRKNASPGGLRVEPVLFFEEPDGSPGMELRRIYGAEFIK